MVRAARSQTAGCYPINATFFGRPQHMVFDQTRIKTMYLRFVGPHSYLHRITLILKANGGEWHITKLPCQG